MNGRTMHFLIFGCAVLMFLPVIGGLSFSRSTDNRYPDRHRSMSVAGQPLGFAGEPQGVLVLLSGISLITSAIFWQSRRIRRSEEKPALTLIDVSDCPKDNPDKLAA